MLNGFSWRVGNIRFCDLMYKMIKHFGDTRHAYLIRAKYEVSVSLIFEKKANVLLFIEICCDLLNKWIIYLNKNQAKLVVALQKEYHKQGIKNVKPVLELSQYVTMINLEQMDWKNSKILLQQLIQNDVVSIPAFYCFMNEAVDLAIRKEISIESALNDHVLLQRLDLRATETFKTNWFSLILPSYNHATFVKYQIQLNKMNDGKNSKQGQKSGRIDYQNQQSGFQPRQNQRPVVPNRQGNGKNKNENGVSRKINNWIKDKKQLLKKDYVKSMGDFCTLWNMKDGECNAKNVAYCRLYGRIRMHSCFCGAKHRAYQCKAIWK